MMKYLLFLVGLQFLVSCTKQVEEVTVQQQFDIDKAIIRAHLSEKGIKADSTKNGLYFTYVKKGTDTISPTISDTAKVYYLGYFLNGKVFDKRLKPNAPFEFAIKSVVPAWQEALPLMKKGDKITIFSPSVLGYGVNGSGSIPGNSVLIFDIELEDFY
jgi:FKBP-type peptidyl-prolyl cis-trans isomerase